MKKKYIIISAFIVILVVTFLTIISPIYRNYNDATFVKNFSEDKETVFVNTFYGLFKINKKTNELSQLKNIDGYILKIVVDENDEKWVISDNTLYSFKNENKITKHNCPFKNESVDTWENLVIEKLFGAKWILNMTGFLKYELYSYEFGRWEKYTLPEDKFLVGDKIQVNENADILFLSGNKHLLLFENFGIMNPRDWNQIDYPTKDFSLNKSFVDKENNLWITQGLNENCELYRFQNPNFVKYNINKEIKALDSDTNGKVWIATVDGVEILNEKKSFIPNMGISKMYIDTDNKKWVEKYHSHSIECYDGKEWKSYNFEIFKHVVKDFFNNLL